MKDQVLFWPKGFNLHVYESVLYDKQFQIAYKNSIQYAVVGTAISLFVLVTGAYALSKKHCPFGRQIQFLIIVTLLFSGGMIPMYVIIKKLGLLNTMWAIVLPSAFTAYNLIILRSFFSTFPKELEDAGRIDGLSDIGILIRLVIPNSRGIIAAIGLFCFAAYWNSFIEPLIYLTDENKYPLQIMLRQVFVLQIVPPQHAYEQVKKIWVAEDAEKYARYFLSIIPLVLIYPFIQKHFIKAVIPGSVKGRRNPADLS